MFFREMLVNQTHGNPLRRKKNVCVFCQKNFFEEESVDTAHKYA